jgi:M61 glycyl aminopeptidase
MRCDLPGGARAGAGAASDFHRGGRARRSEEGLPRKDEDPREAGRADAALPEVDPGRARPDRAGRRRRGIDDFRRREDDRVAPRSGGHVRRRARGPAGGGLRGRALRLPVTRGNRRLLLRFERDGQPRAHQLEPVARLSAGRQCGADDLRPGAAAPGRLEVCDGPGDAKTVRAADRGYKGLVAETGALFGSRPYRHYDFLLTLSDHTAHFGLEHHESSDNRVPERSFLDPRKRRANLAGLLPHEMVHTWNAKYRRPAIMAVGKFDEPVRGDLLWVYEGLTTYLGGILTPRSGLIDPEQYRQGLAYSAADMDTHKGRAWRPLADTAVAAQILFGSRHDGAAWRRGVDFYAESELLWLEADTVIRRQTNGRKSLDDFCRLFHGGHSGSPKVLPFTFEDLSPP